MMMTTNEAAAALGLTRRRVIALINSGKLKAEKPGRDWIVDSESVEELRQQKRPGGRPKKAKNPTGNHSPGHSSSVAAVNSPAAPEQEATR